MCWVCHQISLIPEKVHLERKHQCLDQLCSPKLRLCSSRAKHKMNILGNLLCCKLTTVPGLHCFSGGCDCAETSPPCVLPSLLFFLFFLKRKHYLTIRLSQIRREIAYQRASLQPGSRSTDESRAPPGVLPWDLKEHFHRMHFKEGRVSISQLNGCDAQRPDVTTSVIGWVILLFTSNDLPDKSKTQHISPLSPQMR